MKDHVGPMERPRLALANRVIQSEKKTIKKQSIILPFWVKYFPLDTESYLLILHSCH